MRTSASGMVTPTVELNALAMKRGERTVYVVENGAPPHHPVSSPLCKTQIIHVYTKVVQDSEGTDNCR